MRPPLAATHGRTGSQPQQPEVEYLLTEEDLFPSNELNFIKKQPFSYASYKNPVLIQI
jgi:hypothetical protein